MRGEEPDAGLARPLWAVALTLTIAMLCTGCGAWVPASVPNLDENRDRPIEAVETDDGQLIVFDRWSPEDPNVDGRGRYRGGAVVGWVDRSWTEISIHRIIAVRYDEMDTRAAYQAQDLVGHRVRIWSNGKRLTGTVLTLESDSLLVVPAQSRASGPLSLPVGGIERLQVSNGDRRRTKKAALWGLAVGAVLGGLASADDPNGFLGPSGRVLVVGVTGVLGAGVGALVGTIPTEHWEDAQIE